MVFKKSAKFKIHQNFVPIYCITSINSTIMAVLKYLQKEGPEHESSALSKKETEQMNERVRQVLMTAGKRNAVLLEVPIH